jgi:hypothetical protein
VRVNPVKSSYLVLAFDLLLVIGCILLLIGETNPNIQWGILLSGLTASLMEPFYENAGAITGKWEFHESSLKLGRLSWEMIPIAFSGTLIATYFTYQMAFFPLFISLIPVSCLVLSIVTLVVFSWLTFVKKQVIETLWLVIPLFAYALSFPLPEIAGLILFTVYLGSTIEMLLLKYTKAYTYSHGYRPAVTTIAYAFFISFCYAIFIQPGTEIVSTILSVNPILLWIIVGGILVIHLVLIYRAFTKDWS